MTAKEFAALPDNVQVREVHLLIRQQGFDQKLFLCYLESTLVYTKAKLAQLYQWRWEVELDLRHVKPL